MNKTYFTLLTTLLMTTLFPLYTFADAPKLWIEGNYVNGEPILQEGRTLVPLRFISETLGIPITWDDATKQVALQKGEQTYTFTIAKAQYLMGDQTVDLDVAPQIIHERTYVPLRVIAEIFDKQVDWDGTNRTVIIGNGYVPPAAAPKPPVAPAAKSTNPVKSPTVYDTTQGKIKGNRNSMIYHCPGQRDYNRISVKNVVYFDTEEAAQAAGYRRALR